MNEIQRQVFKTVEEINDSQFEETVIKIVNKHDKWYEITREDGLSQLVEDVGIEPKPGSIIRCYGKGIGFIVRGIAIDGKVVFYRTDEEQRIKNENDLREEERKKKEEFEQNIQEHDNNYNKLPKVFQRRIDIFRTNNPDFRWKYEAYEVFSCLQAVEIANHLKNVSVDMVKTLFDKLSLRDKTELEQKNLTNDVVSIFRRLTVGTQKELVPTLDSGHSGNTFGYACFMARVYLEKPEKVIFQHGALCVLVGCREFGCAYGNEAYNLLDRNKHAHEILGVDEYASPEQITEAYREKAQIYHPDKNGIVPEFKEIVEENMKIINAAYDEMKLRKRV